MSLREKKTIKLIQSDKNPLDITKYLLFRFGYDGGLVTNLKMQKLLYFVYVWNLLLNKKRSFKEKFQAWPIGPVLPTIYKKLKKYGSSPVDSNYCGVKNRESLKELEKTIGGGLKEIIDIVYEQYGIKSAFELVNLTHNDISWINARKNLGVGEKTNNEISDKDILLQYAEKK